MVTLAGKVLKDNKGVASASVQAYVYDPVNNIKKWSNVVKTDASGRYQISFGDIRKLHQNFSDSAEIIVAAWDDDKERTATHANLGTAIYKYDGDALCIVDVKIFKANQCSYYLVNNSITIKQKEKVSYTPVFESLNQASHFHGESVFPQSNVTRVLMYNGENYIKPYDLIFQDAGKFNIFVRGVSVGNISFSDVLHVTVTKVEENNSLTLEDINLDQGLAFFVVRDKGIKDNVLNASIYNSQRYKLSNVKFYVDGTMVKEITDFSTPLVSITLPDVKSNTRHVKMVSTGTIKDSNKKVEYTYEQDVKNFKTITGDISISLDANSGKYTAALHLNDSSEVSEILWQIVYKSTIIEKVLQVSNADETALINILYQKYSDPNITSLEFKALQPGTYSVIAYVINTAGVYSKISKDLIIPGNSENDQDLKVGDSITIGCISNNGKTPILSVHRLYRKGYVKVDNIPMDNAYDNVYVHNYVIEEDDSFYVFKAADSVVIKKVGTPKGCAIAYTGDNENGQIIPYQLKDFDGNIIDSGNLDDSGSGVYYKIMPENAHGVLTVGNTHKIL